MKITTRKKAFFIIAKLCLVLTTGNLVSCEDFVDIDPPTNQLTGSLVFEETASVEAAFAHIHAQLRETAFTNGNSNGLSYLMGHYSDELVLYSSSLPGVNDFSNNNVLPTSSTVEGLWDSSYNLIYATNQIIEGVQASSGLLEPDKERFLGEAYFLRGFIHFNLFNLFGAIPYIGSTDYRQNSQIPRDTETVIYDRLEDDLSKALEMLPEADHSLSRLRPNRWTAKALLARVLLYEGEWEKAMVHALDVIQNGNYGLESNLGSVFKKGSTETLWQLDAGTSGANTYEASTFIFISGPPPNSALSTFLVDSFDPNDQRLNEWIGSVTDGSETWYFPFKYQLQSSTASTEECSVLFRLAEQYLIVAEASTQLGNTSEALDYLNIIRERAALEPLGDLSREELLEAILDERRKEFFTEQGHRFFDLKRSGSLDGTLSGIKTGWESTDRVLPIPQSELLLNPALLPQNEGY